MCLFIKDTFVLLKLTMLSEYIFIGGTVGGWLWLRKKMPERERPIKVNLFFPVVFLLGCIFIIVMTCIITPEDSLLCVLVILIGVPVYYIFVVVKKPKGIKDIIGIFIFV